MGDESKTEIIDPEELRNFVDKNYHKVRNCLDYEDEYIECSRIKGRFHQYFIYGEFEDCSTWKSDFTNCVRAEENKSQNLKQLASIIRHEDERYERRMQNHLRNDVWPKRTEPPKNWNSELPEWMKERQKIGENVLRAQQCVIL